ncbi:helix-turn-helix domain-containing protein [Streptomyces sp. NPDC085529]|uniref:helix-turn-helix domain-containing protein n=1 Tax=Streptomyces sp. NPDC085529 TaxID=3365729 RepID=UPI0037D8B087
MRIIVSPPPPRAISLDSRVRWFRRTTPEPGARPPRRTRCRPPGRHRTDDAAPTPPHGDTALPYRVRRPAAAAPRRPPARPLPPRASARRSEATALAALLRASPGFLSAEALLEQVGDEHADPFTNTVAVTVGRLRRKLGSPPIITTVPTIGYRIDDTAPDRAEPRRSPRPRHALMRRRRRSGAR